MTSNAAPGWHADPTGSFEHRYWDGVAWTDHVASGGVQSVSPLGATLASSSGVLDVGVSEGATPRQEASGLTPEGWYVDPTGTHELRFWGGQVWTDRVRDHGVEALDSEGFDDAPTSAVTGLAVSEKPKGFLERRRDERAARLAGRETFENLAMRAARGDISALAELPGAIDEARSHYKERQLAAKRWEVAALSVRHVIDDDILTEAEQKHVFDVFEALGTPFAELQGRNLALFEELVIAMINDGRFPKSDPSQVPVLLKAGEALYGAFQVGLMKEVVKREFRGGSQSVSVPIGFGMRYRVGGMRGRSVVVGTELVAEDSGILAVTSKRAVFAGQKKTLEFRYDRLVGLQQYSDGIRMNVSNRQTASLFKFPPSSSATIAGATIAAAASRV